MSTDDVDWNGTASVLIGEETSSVIPSRGGVDGVAGRVRGVACIMCMCVHVYEHSIYAWLREMRCAGACWFGLVRPGVRPCMQA